MQVVTWQSPGGGTMKVCRKCEEDFRQRGKWPRNARGEEYCTVSRGAHEGVCEAVTHDWRTD